MVRSIYLSGGITLLPNFPERLEAELNRLTPSHLVPKVCLNMLNIQQMFVIMPFITGSRTSLSVPFIIHRCMRFEQLAGLRSVED